MYHKAEEFFKAVFYISIIIAMIALSMIPAHASTSPFTTRTAGAYTGLVAQYDTWVSQSYFWTTIYVDNVSGSVIGFHEVLSNPATGLTFQNQTVYLDVSASVFSFPPFFIAGQFHGGPIYPGSTLNGHTSLLGHIWLGQWRGTVWTDNNSPNVGSVSHYEWDFTTGLLYSALLNSNDIGIAYQLRYTNAWTPSPYWGFLGYSLYVGWGVLPISIIIVINYLFTFLLVGVFDWAHVRKSKNRTSAKMGNMMWFQIKTMIIASLIIMAILITALVLLSLFLRG